MALVSTFESFTNVVETLNDEEKVPEDQLHKHMNELDDEEKQKLLEFVQKPQSGGGMPRCYPLSYMQGNFAFHELKKY